MPVKSKAQQKAMYAAAEGDSTLGISKQVGKEFIKSPAPKDLPKTLSKKK